MISLPDQLEEILSQNQRPAPVRWLAREVRAPEGAVLAALKKDERFLGLPDGLWTTRSYGCQMAGKIAGAFSSRVFGPRDLRTVLGIDRKEVMPLLDWLQAKKWVVKAEGGFEWTGPHDLTLNAKEEEETG